MKRGVMNIGGGKNIKETVVAAVAMLKTEQP